MNTTYRYTGPNSAVTLKVSDGAGGLKDLDVILWNGHNVELPADHKVTVTMLHQGLLAPISQTQAPAPTEDKTDAVASLSQTQPEPGVAARAKATK